MCQCNLAMRSQQRIKMPRLLPIINDCELGVYEPHFYTTPQAAALTDRLVSISVRIELT
ncbi:hypothetical protein DPMN_117060 [Dreissena polymorpha]|uniref:Uncharacterized protein n=1 Tax=Dreissena polymorpha TaxID=45954 RepID=A0A9D4QVB1_DREPO|nr:hypothetical protein DPMN_117060 [Dreissena polymorpha]